jgi:crotonobetainyl-CoA:carnitine CoA-transferase CaiB-like acyl-CoA transferase
MLTGLKIIDFTRVLAGPLCTMTLGDLGANVIKFERPGLGDDTRGWGPPFAPNGLSAYFISINRNKKSVIADLSNAEDRELVTRLIADADVVVDNFRRGALDQFGLPPDTILEQCPNLVWCSISGFGPSSDRPGYDFVVQAESGWMSITGDEGGAPVKSGLPLADIVAGKDATIAILAALASRPSPAANRRLHISLTHSATAALVNIAQNVMVGGHDARRLGNAHPNLVPYQLFAARDRSLVVAVGSDSQWRACAAALGLNDFAADPMLATNAQRMAERERIVAAMQARIETQMASWWLSRLSDAGVPCGVVKTVREALADIESSAATGISPSIPGRLRLAPPLLGEHDAEVRRDGWNAFRRENRLSRE